VVPVQVAGAADVGAGSGDNGTPTLCFGPVWVRPDVADVAIGAEEWSFQGRGPRREELSNWLDVRRSKWISKRTDEKSRLSRT
jgi:hypothetical protein